jgi:hypothetical protein
VSVKDLREALTGPRGSIDGYLECVGEDEFRADVLAFADANDPLQRSKFAAMALQGILANCGTPFDDHSSSYLNRKRLAFASVAVADALIAELSKGAK